ncbi:hypothetical protein FY528_10100 [Hymenobacter lutimineralis]|uniref:Esterase-like activity of phytase family protein n=1 Tax=Hymenobacter lutimineralis TaxID=2606448 RepID=A0A5D6V207_9BACT|nr:hypothetical protein [Hymenobacter lutimineralis]TYZ09586.1 hypothetical protein FY528_10100 [Hymenobacter lutimineralis]
MNALLLLRDRLAPLAFFLHAMLCGCTSNTDRGSFEKINEAYKVEQVGRMRREDVVESSGLALANDHGDLWTHGDGGNTSLLYKVTLQGDLLTKHRVPDANNIDWEDLAQDRQHGYLFVGDFGNNGNKRRDLRIYRLQEPALKQVDTIAFHYPDQRTFPPRKAARNFDCEAFFYADDSLHLFTKNRGKGGWVKYYKVPARPGNHVAVLVDSIRINTWITAADISPDGQLVALLGYGHAYLLERQPGRKLFDGPKSCLPLTKTGQAEGLVFVNKHDFVVSNEKGRLYRASLR